MDIELEKNLLRTTEEDLFKYIELGYTKVGPITKLNFCEYTGLASVSVTLKKNVHDYHETPLEKNFTYKLFDNGINQSWNYVDSDGY
ncbi:hypothetical protein ACUIJ0_12245 [Acinetobacter junii]|uniref:hypothetical protein n=1 Tax=Acinetobacter junii TaxID=40215 RepID=UPI00125041B6|nr:hypothetical protein [Acinetobacter junii]